MPRVQLRNHKVHYQQTGQGPDIVLIHGLSCNIAFWWFHVAAHLAHSHRVTAIDLRGHGFSGMTETGYRAVDLAGDVAALLEHLDLRRTHVIGHSYGGAVSASLAAERPDLVAELTLADAWLPSLQPIPPIQGVAEWAATRARAEARGIEIDAHLPLVVRGLFSELLDEIDFLASDHDEHALHRGADHWEDGARPPGAAQPGGWRGSRIAGLWAGAGTRAGLAAGLGAGVGAGGGPRFLRRGAAGGPMQPSAAPRIDRMTAEARAARRQALQGALMMTGSPGQPSQAVRRWHDLMHDSHARTEFLDVTGIEAPALRDIRGDVRLVYGARSAYRPTADALQDLLPRARLQIVPRASHYFPLLRPQALLRALEDRFEPTALRGKPNAPRLRLIAARKEVPVPAPNLTGPPLTPTPLTPTLLNAATLTAGPPSDVPVLARVTEKGAPRA